MVTPIKMPELGESITEGTITRWLKQEGDHVETDEPLFEVSTDKVDTEVPSPVAGVLSSIKVHEDETVPVGTELAEIEPADATAGGAGGTRGRGTRGGAGGTRGRGAGGGRRGGHGAHAGARRVDHRGHDHPLAQAGRRPRRDRRATLRGLHRQGRHRGPLPRRRGRPEDP